jgi:type I restriction enzyme, S subunit
VITDLKPYRAYRDSGVEWLGKVPEGWEVRRLGSITTPVSRRGRPDLPLLSVVREKGVILREEGGANHNVVPEDLTNYKVVDPGNLVINKMKAWQGSLGIANVRGIVSPAYFVYVLGDLSGRYLHALLRSKPYVGAFFAASEGVRVGQWDLSLDGLKAIPALIPPPDEQASIAIFLDYAEARIDRLVSAKERLIGLLREEKETLIDHAVTRGLDPSAPLEHSGVDWLGEVPQHWTVDRLRRSVASSMTGAWGGEPNGVDDVVCVRVADFDRESRGVKSSSTLRALPPAERRRRQLRRGDLLLEKSGGGDSQPVGAVVLFDQGTDAVSSNFVARLRAADGYAARFLLYLHWALYVRRLTVRSVNQTTGIQNLDLRSYLSEKVAFPPESEQGEIADHLDRACADVDRISTAARAHVDLLREYRTRLISDVVTGKLDVREAAESLPEDPDDGDPALDERLEEVAAA